MIQFLEGLFVFGAVGFWVLLGFASTMLCVAEEDNQNSALATFTLLSTAFVLWLCNDIHPLIWMSNHWQGMLIYLFLYFLTGSGWSLFMFWRKAREEYNDFKAYAPRTRSSVPPSPQDKVRQYKGTIIHWICYWPPSLLWFTIKDLVKSIADYIFELLTRLYEKVWASVWKNDIRGH